MSSFSLQNPKTYSRFVRILRVSLLLLAFLATGVMFLWRGAEAPSEISTTEEVNQDSLEMLNTRYDGLDNKGNPFSIMTTKALQPTRESPFIDLWTPKAEITMQEGDALAVKSTTGRYNEEEAQLLLQGGVELFHESGYQVFSEAISFDLSGNQVWSDHPVLVQGTDVVINAKGFKLLDKGKTLIFIGPVTVNFRGKSWEK